MIKKSCFSLFIIGDEILSGKRIDRHFEQARKILSSRGLSVSWSCLLRDDKDLIKNFLKFSFENKNQVFSFGGIGSTPDDHTREASASALNLKLLPDLKAVQLIKDRCEFLNVKPGKERLRMAEFPEGSSLIPNPVNGVPGFSILNHFFLPGFPNMAWPMMEWVLDTYYYECFSTFSEIDHSFSVNGLYESSVTPLLEFLTKKYPIFSIYSLPNSDIVPNNVAEASIELGIKCQRDFKNDRELESLFTQAIIFFRNEINMLGGKIIKENLEKR